MDNFDIYYSVPEVALKYDVSPETVRRWIRRGKLYAFISSRKEGYRIPASELDRLDKFGRMDMMYPIYTVERLRNQLIAFRDEVNRMIESCDEFMN